VYIIASTILLAYLPRYLRIEAESSKSSVIGPTKPSTPLPTFVYKNATSSTTVFSILILVFAAIG